MRAKLIQLDKFSAGDKKRIVALGFFDGFHEGHQNLVKELLNYASKTNLTPILFTFDESPKKILCPDKFDGYLTNQSEKLVKISKYGISEIITAHFDENFSKMSCKQFVKEILVDKLNADTVFVGFNFSFGANREGNSEIMAEELHKYGRKCHITFPYKINGEIVSSSAIRHAIKDGDMEKANLFLGSEFIFSGIVEHGDARGRTMGFPTANLPLKDSEKILPPNGVYACYTDTEKGTFPSVVNMGFRPTFDKDIHLLEAHLIDFNDDLYDQPIRVRFIKMLRKEVKFNSMNELINQIAIDKASAIKILKP